MKKNFAAALGLMGFVFAAALNGCGTANSNNDFAAKVDQRIGTGGHGHVFMGANVPFGMVQLGPTSIPMQWDWTSGYHRSDSTVIGFSHTHLSGTGIGDLFDVTVMPVVGEVEYSRKGISSLFSHANERMAPGFYATQLERYNIGVELTATERVGLHRYTFPEAKDAAIVFDMKNGGGWDQVTEGVVTQVSDSAIEGWRYSRGWANDQRVYFAAEFSRPFQTVTRSADSLYTRFEFATKAGEIIELKVALSPVSVEGARANLAAEAPGWEFEKVRQSARNAWNAELSKIKIKADPETEKIFYTALYHTMIAPSLFSDTGSQNRYTTFSLWDTYRAAHPLMTIVHPEKVPDMMNTMLEIYNKQGKLPVWHLWGNETDCMVGNPGIPVVADAVLKGFEGFDKDLAYEAMKTSAMLDERGLNFFKEYGYIPFDKYNESVATCLEYALADWALGQVAERRGDSVTYQYFNNRSKAYRHYFDAQTGFLRGKDSEGNWREPFNPFAAVHRMNDYTEGTGWQYTWLVPHDVEGLAEQFGGMDNFHTKLDSLFVVEGDLGKEASPDITGLIGQYAHGNEPGHHTIYFYTMTGQPAKTADLVRRVLSEMYRAEPDGLSGNEDVGQMSAWYVLSALGFYQVEPAGGRYFFGSPIIDEATIKVRGGTFKIKTQGNSATNKYIQSITLNGVEHKRAWIDFEEIAAGGELVFVMGSQPAVWY